MKPRRLEESFNLLHPNFKVFIYSIHHNLVTGKCPSDLVIRAEMLTKNFIEYEHSRASFYENHLVTHFRPEPYIDLKKISWWKEWVY